MNNSRRYAILRCFSFFIDHISLYFIFISLHFLFAFFSERTALQCYLVKNYDCFTLFWNTKIDVAVCIYVALEMFFNGVDSQCVRRITGDTLSWIQDKNGREEIGYGQWNKQTRTLFKIVDLSDDSVLQEVVLLSLRGLVESSTYCLPEKKY